MFLSDFARLQTNSSGAVIDDKEKHNAGEEIKPERVQIADAFSGEKFVREFPRLDDEQAESREKFRVPVQKRIEHIDNHVPKGAAIIDGRLAALRAMRASQFRAAVFAMRKRQRLLIFAAAKPASSRSPFDRGDRSIAENNLCRLVGHCVRLQKRN